MSRKILILIFLMFSGFAFSQTTVSLEDQCNCEVLQGTDVSAPGANTPAGADLGDLYVNTTTGTIYFWDGNSWELTSTDTNTTNASLTEDGVNLILTDSDLNTVSIPLADIAAIIDTNTTNVTFTVNSTNGTLDIIDSDTNVVSVPLADIAALVDTDEQEGTEVPLTNPLDVDGDGNDETTVEEAIADLAASNGLDLDIDPANELTTSGSGVPAGAPVNDNPGVTYLDTATNELYVYDGTNWTMVTDNQNAGEVAVTPAGNITSTDVQAALEELDSDITTSELTTTVVEGSGTDVSTNVVGNNTEYTVSTEISATSGNNLSVTTDGLFAADDQNAGEVAVTPAGNITSTDVQAALEELDSDITSSELTTTVVEGSGTDVSTNVVGNNTEYTVAVNVSELTGDGDITSGDLTVGGDANALLGDVTLEIAAGAVGNTELAADAVTSDKILDGTISSGDITADAVNAATINADVAGAGLVQNASGALDVDVTALTGDGSITSTDLTVTGGANSTLNDVTLTIADNAITNAKMADDAITTAELATGAVESSDILDGTIATGDIANDAVTLGKLAAGSASGDLIQWNGTDWEYIAPSTLIPATTVSNTSNVNTLSTTVDGVTGTGVPIINSNALGLNGSNELISTVNGEASAALDLSPAINAIEKTTTVVEGSGTDVSTNVVGNNTEYTVAVNVSELTGDGDITSGDLTVGGDANALLGDVTLEIAAGAVGNTELAADAVTSDKILDGTISSDDIAADAVNNTKLADDAVQLENIADGTALGQVMQWDGSDWTLIDLGSVTVMENDGVIGNEVTNATDGTLVRSGSGTTISPYTLGVATGGIDTNELADDAVNAAKINADVAGAGLVQNASGALDVDVTALTGDGSITSTDLTVTGGANSTLNDVTLTIADNAITNAKMADDAITTAELATGAVESSDILDGTIATGDIADDAVTLGKLAAGSASGDLIQWNGTDWEFVAPSTLIPATTVSNTSNVNTLSTTVDGVTGTGVPIINSNALGLNGSNELISTVNGEASAALDLSPAINAIEKTTTVVEGTGIDVSSTTTGNNT
ncbi:hypothetical protein HZY62_21630, partial [Maribacter polysiphoniae]|nr:hypothetical protein [Maribacter polysiphoniae]